MTTKSMMVLGMTLALAAPAAAQTAERTPLAWSVKVGDVLYYSFSTKRQEKMGVAGGRALTDSATTLSFTVTETVKSVDAGTASVEATITSIKLNQQITAMGMARPPSAFDSTMPDETSLYRFLAKAVGKTFSFKRSSTGEVTELAGGAAIEKALGEAAEAQFQAMLKARQGGQGGPGGMGGMMGGMGGNMARMAAAQFSANFADETLQQHLDSVSHVLPADPKSEGESWTSKKDDPAGALGRLQYTAKYTHGGAVNNMTRVKIGLEGEMTIAETAADPSAGGNPMAAMMANMLRGLELTEANLEGSATFGSGKLVDCELSRSLKKEGAVPPMLQPMLGAAPDAKLALNISMTSRYEVQEGPPVVQAPIEEEGATEEKQADDDGDRNF